MDTDLVVAPQSLNQIVELLMGQNQKISELQQLMQQQPKNQLPDPVDHTEVLADMKNELKKSQEREEQLLAIVQQLQSDLDELKKVSAKSKWRFWGKDQDLSVTYAQLSYIRKLIKDQEDKILILRLLKWVGVILVFSMLFNFLYFTVALKISLSDPTIYYVYILWAVGMVIVFSTHYFIKKSSKRRDSSRSLQ